MAFENVDAYLASLDEPRRSTLQTVRERIRAILPEAVEAISYNCPVFKLDGKRVAGFVAFANHLTYAPHSGTSLAGVSQHLTGFKVAKGSFQFPTDEPLSTDLLRILINARLAELGLPTR